MSIYELTPGLALLRTLALGFCAVSFAGLVLALSRISPLPEPSCGDPCQRMRTRARSQPTFARLEPLLARLAALVSCLPLDGLRARLRVTLERAGQPLGLRPDELLAVCVLSGIGTALLAYVMVGAAGVHWTYVLIAAALGPALPLLRVRAAVARRAKELDRSLPIAIDLCTLCMSAGSDLPGALQMAVSDLGAPHLVCRDELGRVLDDLVLGAPRVTALTALAARSASRAVHEFVSAVCLSEQKGTPLVDTLTIQAACLRQRRSVRAEELAAQASVKMIGPMLLLVVSILLVIFGPFIVNGAGL